MNGLLGEGHTDSRGAVISKVVDQLMTAYEPMMNEVREFVWIPF